jgi:uncharacterized protein (TIRG00374 family)
VLRQLRGKIILSTLLGVAVVVALGLLSDIGQVGQSFNSFAWATLPAILGFTALNYVLRWLKWDYYLRRMGMAQGVGYAGSGLLFTSGMLMAVTPGKVGEVLKSYLLKRLNGTAISASAPIVLAERVTDGLAMLLLMGFGLTLYAPARPAFYLLVMLTAIGLLVLQSRRLFERIIELIERAPLGRRIAPRLMTAYLSMKELLSWRILLISTIISLISWFGECVAMYFVLRGLGVAPSFLLLQQATFVFAASTLFGLISFLPGGLGVSEGSSTLMLERLIPLPAGPATTATIIIRFCTLWFGVTLGAIALALFSRRYGEERVADDMGGSETGRPSEGVTR